jgi:serine/threonine-protein kinase RsbW
MLVVRKLIVDDLNPLFDAQGMKYVEYPSDFSRIRQYAAEILATCPEPFREGNLLEQQLSEIIKNGIKHGNKGDSAKKIKVWYDLRKRARFIVEDEGSGFQRLEEWNDFFAKRQTALANNDFETFLTLANYRGPDSDDNDGGNSLIAALEYWNGGMIFSGKRNKVGVVRWFSGGSGI